MRDSFYTAEQVAGMLGMHVKTVQRYMREGKLRASRIGRRWRVSGHDLSAFTESLKAEDSAPEPRDVKVSSVVDIPVSDRDGAIRILNALTAALNSKPPEYGASSMTAQYLEGERTVRAVLWGTLRFAQAMLEFVVALAGAQEGGSE